LKTDDFQRDEQLSKGYLEKLLISPTSSLHSKFYPQHIKHMPAVKFQMCLEFEQII